MPQQLTLTLILMLCIATTTSFHISKYNQKSNTDISGLLKLQGIVRNIDGSQNNQAHPNWGKSYTNLIRKTPVRYQDGKSVPLQNLPNPRFLSQSISKVEDNIVTPNQFNLTMLWGTWGQFLDHDITLSDQGNTEPVKIIIPRCDRFFDKNCSGKQFIPYFRSQYDPSLPERTNTNQLTAWIDASMVYGSTKEVNDNLRTFKEGKLKTSGENLLPFDSEGNWYAGDKRCAENMGLTTLQVLMLREHNRLCDEILKANGSMSDGDIFNTAKNYVIGLVQNIGFYQYLPHLFGRIHFNLMIGQYQGYNPEVDPTIMTEFSSTVYRIGHPYIPRFFKAIDNNNQTIEKINLRDLMVNNNKTFNSQRFNTLLKGLAWTLAKERDLDYVNQLRNMPPQIMGMNFDLFAINTDRNRDHGVTDYNSLRVGFGLDRIQTFQEIFDDEEDRMFIQKSFNSVDNIDTYVGVLGEVKLPGSMFGDLGARIAALQFSAIRDGDRLWFQNAYPPEVVSEIKATTLTDLILRNTDITNMPIDGLFCHNCTVD